VTAAAFQRLTPVDDAFAHDFPYDAEADRFDDSDGAYAIAEPDPFDAPDPAPLRRPSLRAELGAQPAGAIASLPGTARPPLPVPAALAELLPEGLRRGSTVAVTSSVSLLLTLLGAASAAGAWTAMVGMPSISAEAAVEAGIDLRRLAVVGPPAAGARTAPNASGSPGWTGTSWTTAVGALLDAVDVVVARPAGAGATDGEARRLAARARTKGAVLVLFGQQAASWPAADVRLSARPGRWDGIGHGYGRLTRHQLLLSATGKGRSARPRSAELWL
jgi:hypothetical protein